MGWLEDVGKILPVETVYKDLAQPAVVEVGDVARNSVKAARFVLAPIDYLAAQQGRWQKWLQRIHERVPEENLVTANPQIAGPALNGLKYLDQDSLLAEFFVNLLSRAVDKTRVSEAHPAFASIISQLSPDEALIMFHLSKRNFSLLQYSKLFPETMTFGSRETVENEFPVSELVFPENFFMYMDHLHSLDLAGVWQFGNQQAVWNEGKQVGTNILSYSQLSSFGKLFAKACVPEEILKEK